MPLNNCSLLNVRNKAASRRPVRLPCRAEHRAVIGCDCHVGASKVPTAKSNQNCYKLIFRIFEDIFHFSFIYNDHLDCLKQITFQVHSLLKFIFHAICRDSWQQFRGRRLARSGMYCGHSGDVSRRDSAGMDLSGTLEGHCRCPEEVPTRMAPGVS